MHECRVIGGLDCVSCTGYMYANISFKLKTPYRCLLLYFYFYHFRDVAVPSLNQIQEVIKRFPDETPVVCAVVNSGEVRLYTLYPVILPTPKFS